MFTDLRHMHTHEEDIASGDHATAQTHPHRSTVPVWVSLGLFVLGAACLIVPAIQSDSTVADTKLADTREEKLVEFERSDSLSTDLLQTQSSTPIQDRAMVAAASVSSSVKKLDWLEVPKIGVSSQIKSLSGRTKIGKGIWRISTSSTPPAGSNTVLVAHRWLYTSGPNTFYSLPKLQKGDPVYVTWSGKKYNYIVDEVKVVGDDAIDIEDPTDMPILTLYTCVLYDTSRRVVVIAKPVEQFEDKIKK